MDWDKSNSEASVCCWFPAPNDRPGRSDPGIAAQAAQRKSDELIRQESERNYRE
jgi:hypothetical protein